MDKIMRDAVNTNLIFPMRCGKIGTQSLKANGSPVQSRLNCSFCCLFPEYFRTGRQGDLIADWLVAEGWVGGRSSLVSTPNLAFSMSSRCPRTGNASSIPREALQFALFRGTAAASELSLNLGDERGQAAAV